MNITFHKNIEVAQEAFLINTNILSKEIRDILKEKGSITNFVNMSSNYYYVFIYFNNNRLDIQNAL